MNIKCSTKVSCLYYSIVSSGDQNSSKNSESSLATLFELHTQNELWKIKPWEHYWKMHQNGIIEIWTVIPLFQCFRYQGCAKNGGSSAGSDWDHPYVCSYLRVQMVLDCPRWPRSCLEDGTSCQWCLSLHGISPLQRITWDSSQCCLRKARKWEQKLQSLDMPRLRTLKHPYCHILSVKAGHETAQMMQRNRLDVFRGEQQSQIANGNAYGVKSPFLLIDWLQSIIYS